MVPPSAGRSALPQVPKEKLCKGCGKLIPAEGFSRQTAALDGLQAHCRDCNRRSRVQPSANWNAIKGHVDKFVLLCALPFVAQAVM